MYKVAWIARFLPGMSKDEGRRHWREIHGPLGRKVPGIDRYVQNPALQSLGLVGVSDEPPSFDGYSCCWYADRDAFHASLETPEWDAIMADGPNLFDVDWFWGMSAALDERTIVDGPAGPFKAVWIVRFNDDIRSDAARTREAHEYWINTHGGHFGRRVPGIGRYVQNHVVEPIGADGADETVLKFDGFSECWFEDEAAFERCMSSTEWEEMNRDAENLFDLDFFMTGMCAVLDENVVKVDENVVKG